MSDNDQSNTVPQEQLQHMHHLISEMFSNACITILKQDLDDCSYQFCEDTISNTLLYIRAKRKDKSYQILKNLKDSLNDDCR